MNDYGFWNGFCGFFSIFGSVFSNLDKAIDCLGFLIALFLVVIPISCLITFILYWFTEGRYRGEEEEDELSTSD